MAQARNSEALYESDHGTRGPVVRRSWKLVPGPQGPLLTGIFGFPWRHPVLQARCTDTEIGSGPVFGNMRVDRHHRRVPSLDCTCGIYASDEPQVGWLLRHSLMDSAMVTGFVRLSGRVLVTGPVYRAEEAHVVGPLTLTPPPPRWPRRVGARLGVNRQIRRVTEDADRYLFWYTAGRRGVPIGEWYQQMSEALARRYAVEVVRLA